MASEINRLQQQMRRLMEDMFHQVSPHFLIDQRVWSPQIDILETPEAFFVVAEASGLQKNDIHVTVKGNRVHLYGRRERPPIGNALRYLQVEIEYGTFERVFQLPVPIKEEDIEARYRNGLLSLRLPKKSAQTKFIPIKEA